MKFTEKKASDIFRKWDVSEGTIRVWKHRRMIPDFYKDDPLPLFVVMRRLEADYVSAFEATLMILGDDAWREWVRYTHETQVPSQITEKEIKQRLRDKRTHLKKGY